MKDQFSRTALLFGKEAVDMLITRRVAVFGIGGVGGHCAEALCRSGIGALDLFDGDIVDITNINRQIIATHKTVGLGKAEAMRERLIDISPQSEITARNLFYLPETADTVDLSVYDYIVDAVDTVTAKLELVCRSSALGVPIISSMGAANKIDPTAFEVADIYETQICPLARIMRSELRKRNIKSLKVIYSKEVPVRLYNGGNIDDAPTAAAGNRSRVTRSIPASNSFVPPVAGFIIAGEVIKDLINR